MKFSSAIPPGDYCNYYLNGGLHLQGLSYHPKKITVEGTNKNVDTTMPIVIMLAPTKMLGAKINKS